MPRPRTPLTKAKVTGQAIHNRKRFASRKEPKSRPLGGPSLELSECAKKYWEAFNREVPWLMESHRSLVEVACMARASLFENGFDSKVAGQLRMCLSSMGATPSDATKVHVPNDEEEDPADAFLN